MSKTVSFKADEEFLSGINDFVNKYYQGNKSLMIKNAIEEYIENYEKEDNDRFKKLENELDALKTDVLELRNGLRGLIAQLEKK